MKIQAAVAVALAFLAHVRVARGQQASSATDTVFRLSDVQKPAHLLANSPRPTSPRVLEQADMHGAVHVTYVVDTGGRVVLSSVKTISSSHPLMLQTVRKALPTLRYSAAERNGRKVNQLIDTVFKFREP